MGKKRKILLRFDDICPTMNWEQWDKAKKLLDNANVTALLGVIPDCKDPDLLIDAPKEDFWEYIKELQSQGFTIAMHGCHHVFDIQASGIVTPKKHSEFAGHPYEVQYEKIKKGNDILLSHGIKTDVFFAPAHSYDENTLKALAANGFKYISDGKSPRPYERYGVICIPTHSVNLPIINENKKDYLTLVLHAHEWNKENKKQSWVKFDKICSSYAGNIASFNDYIEWKNGIPFFQIIFEKMVVIRDSCLKPFVKRIIKH